MGSVVGTAVVGPDKRGQAVATMMSGLTIANVIGVPFTTFVGQGLGLAGGLRRGGTARFGDPGGPAPLGSLAGRPPGSDHQK